MVIYKKNKAMGILLCLFGVMLFCQLAHAVQFEQKYVYKDGDGNFHHRGWLSVGWQVKGSKGTDQVLAEFVSSLRGNNPSLETKFQFFVPGFAGYRPALGPWRFWKSTMDAMRIELSSYLLARMKKKSLTNELTAHDVELFLKKYFDNILLFQGFNRLDSKKAEMTFIEQELTNNLMQYFMENVMLEEYPGSSNPIWPMIRFIRSSNVYGIVQYVKVADKNKSLSGTQKLMDAPVTKPVAILTGASIEQGESAYTKASQKMVRDIKAFDFGGATQKALEAQESLRTKIGIDLAAQKKKEFPVEFTQISAVGKMHTGWLKIAAYGYGNEKKNIRGGDWVFVTYEGDEGEGDLTSATDFKYCSPALLSEPLPGNLRLWYSSLSKPEVRDIRKRLGRSLDRMPLNKFLVFSEYPGARARYKFVGFANRVPLYRAYLNDEFGASIDESSNQKPPVPLPLWYAPAVGDSPASCPPCSLKPASRLPNAPAFKFEEVSSFKKSHLGWLFVPQYDDWQFVQYEGNSSIPIAGTKFTAVSPAIISKALPAGVSLWKSDLDSDVVRWIKNTFQKNGDRLPLNEYLLFRSKSDNKLYQYRWNEDEGEDFMNGDFQEV